MPVVRKVFQPDMDVEVDENEAANLRAQGLLVEPAPEPAAPGRPKTPKPEPATETETVPTTADVSQDKEGK